MKKRLLLLATGSRHYFFNIFSRCRFSPGSFAGFNSSHDITLIGNGGRTVIANEDVYKNDALFIGIGPAFLEDDIPGTKEHTLSPCNGPDEMETFMSRLESLNKGVIYLEFKINKQDGFVAGRGGQMYECACLLGFVLKERGIRDNFEIHFFSSDISPDETAAITDRMRERGIILDYGYEPAEFVAGGMLDQSGFKYCEYFEQQSISIKPHELF